MEYENLEDYLRRLEEGQGEEAVTTTPPTLDATSDVVKQAISSRYAPSQDLQAAQKKASESRFIAGMGDAASNLGYAIAGVDAPRNSAFDDLKKTADIPLDAAMDKEKLRIAQEKANSEAVMNAIKMKDQQHARAESNDLRRDQIASTNQLRNAMLGQKAEEKEFKREKEEQELAVPGFERNPSVRQTPVEAGKARDAAGQLESLEKNMDEYMALVDKYGSFEWGGEGGAKMETLATGIQLQLKTLYELGVLNGPDMALLEKQIQDPASWGSLFTRDSTAKEKLRATKSQVIRDALTGLKNKGYNKVVPQMGPMEVGTVDVDDKTGQKYQFIGGNPADKNSWKPI